MIYRPQTTLLLCRYVHFSGVPIKIALSIPAHETTRTDKPILINLHHVGKDKLKPSITGQLLAGQLDRTILMTTLHE
jgi:hypothetical protein